MPGIHSGLMAPEYILADIQTICLFSWFLLKKRNKFSKIHVNVWI